MPQYTDADIQSAIREITRRARTDAQFRQLALTNPNEAVKQATNLEVPRGFKLRFIEPEGADMVVTLPEPAGIEHELSDADLEQVAGGGRGPSFASLTAATCITVGYGNSCG